MTEAKTTALKKAAKRVALDVWRYLAEHPEIDDKENLPSYLYDQIKGLPGRCPLCELFLFISPSCKGCPLYVDTFYCYTLGQPYFRWTYAKSKADRKKAAEDLVRRVEAWDAEE